MKTLYLFRHGQTDWNKQHLIQGFSDIKLNQLGRDQAIDLKSKLSNFKIDAFYSSTLKRAEQTVKIVTQDCHLSIIFSQDLKEANLGQAEGKTISEVKDKFGELFWDISKCHTFDFWNFSYPDGESRREVVNRFTSFVDQIPEQSFAISTHGGILCLYLLSLWQQAQIKIHKIPIPNCALYKIEFKTPINIEQL